jgi:hypothetical protein
LLNSPKGVLADEWILVVGSLLQAGQICLRPNIAQDNADIPEPTAPFEAEDRCVTKFFSKAGVIPFEHLGQISSWNRAELEFARLLGMTIPGANVEALVASKEAISNQGAKLFWD